MGVKGKLGRGDIKVPHPLHHKVIGGKTAVFQSGPFLLGNGYQILLQQDAADLPSGNRVVLDQKPVNLFGKVHIVLNLPEDIFHNLFIDFFGIRILSAQRKLGDIDPVLCDTVIQVFIQADGLINGPGRVSGVAGVYQAPYDDTAIVEHFRKKALVNLVFHGKVIVGSTGFQQLFSQGFKHLILPHQKFFMNRLLVWTGVSVFEMPRIDNVIVDQGKVHIIDRDFDVAGAHAACVELLCVDNICIKDTGQVFFQNLIGGNLEIPVKGQVYVVSRNRFRAAADLDHLSDIVDKYGFASLCSLKGRLHGFFDAKFSHRVIQIIGVCPVLFLQGLKLFLGYLAGIADNMGKIDAVNIFSDGILHNGNPLELVAVLHYNGNRLLADIRGHCGCNVFLIAVVIHVVADGEDF